MSTLSRIWISLLVAFSLISSFTGVSHAAVNPLSTRVTADWGAGYCSVFTLQNPSTTQIKNWSIQYTLGSNTRAYSEWSGVFSRAGNTVTIKPLSWNTVIKNGDRYEIGFCANGRDKPSNVVFTPITGSTTTTPVRPTPTPPKPVTPTPVVPTPTPVTPTPVTPTPPTGVIPSGAFTPPLSVRGGDVYDSKNTLVQLRGVNWFGFETSNFVVHGLWQVGYKDTIRQMKSLGFNAVRLPFCPGTLQGKTPNSINYALNPDLTGKNSLELMDAIIGELANNGIYTLLDFHREDCNSIGDLPNSNGYSTAAWIKDLQFVANRYKNTPSVIGIDLKNEPHGTARWGNGDTNTDWKLMAEQAGSAVLKINPNLLIFVEGIQSNNGNCESGYNAFWGGELSVASCSLIRTSMIPSNRLVYSPHVYGPDVYMQPYFSDPNFPENMPSIWDAQFGKLQGSSIIIPGEFGGKYAGKDQIWQNRFVDYLISKKIRSFFFWSWNPNSGDTGGILQDDWKSINTAKYNNLKRLMQ